MDHPAELTVNKIQRSDEIGGRYAHKGLYYFHFFFSSTTGNDLRIEFRDKITIGGVTEIKILHDGFPFHA